MMLYHKSQTHYILWCVAKMGLRQAIMKFIFGLAKADGGLFMHRRFIHCNYHLFNAEFVAIRDALHSNKILERQNMKEN